MSVRMMMQGRKPAAGGGGISSPLDVADCTVWLDADDPTKFTYSSGVTVSTWVDKSSLAKTYSLNGTAPTRDATVNGRSALNWNNGDLRATNIRLNDATTGAFTAFGVVKASTTSGQRMILASESGGPGYPLWHNGSAVGVFVSGVVENGPNLVINETHVVHSTAVANGTSEAFRNGVSNGASAITTLSSSGTATASIGRRHVNGTLDFAGVICEVVCYSRILTSTEVTNVLNYLASKWGVTI